MNSVLKKLLGAVLVLVGALFGIFPFVPGILLIFVGLELLGVPLVPWEKLQSYWRRKEKRKEEHSEQLGKANDSAENR